MVYCLARTILVRCLLAVESSSGGGAVAVATTDLDIEVEEAVGPGNSSTGPADQAQRAWAELEVGRQNFEVEVEAEVVARSRSRRTSGWVEAAVFPAAEMVAGELAETLRDLDTPLSRARLASHLDHVRAHQLAVGP